MERSGWDDDDDGFVPPPSQRAWRHPSELGGHAFVPADSGRPSRGQFALAVAAGALGSLAIATLAVVVTGTAHRSASVLGAHVDAAAPLGGAGTALTTLLSTTVADGTVATAPGVVTTTPVDLATSVAPVSVPSVIGLHRPDHADDTEIAAVVVDDTTLLAEPEDVAGLARLEARLADGSTVSVVVEGLDADTGLVRLRTRGALAANASDSGTWLGVRCSDEIATAAGSSTDTTVAEPTAPGATLGPLASAATAAPPTTSRATVSVVSAVPTTVATAVAAPSSTTVVATTAAAVARSTAAAAVPVAPGTTPTSVRAPAASSAPTTAPAAPVTTSAAPTSAGEPTATPSTTIGAELPATPPASRRVVHVRDVVDGSPAALSGVRAGDLITSIDGRPVRSMWSLVLAVRRHTIGDTITIAVNRDGAVVDVMVVLARQPGGGA